MDNELHYVNYDPEELWQAMVEAYVAEGGDLLYGGDEKEMLLRAVQSILVQSCAGMDNALRQATLRYAEGDFLDTYGEKRNCPRIEAGAAISEIEITFRADARMRTIPEGYAVTADGQVMYLLTEDVVYTGAAQVMRCGIVCQNTGNVGNGLLSGTQMQFARPQEGVVSVTCVADAHGGQNREADDVYRERIRENGLANVTTGPRSQYESAAKAVSTEIIDAKAYGHDDIGTITAGSVAVYILPAHEEGLAALLQSVREALNRDDVRPLTDQVTVARCTDIVYTITAEYSAEGSGNVLPALQSAVAEYQTWQDTEIGRAFNPDRLMALLYNAGATRVVWSDDSEFGDGGDIEYTEIAKNARCKGTITLEEITT